MPDPSTRVEEECPLIDALALIHPTAKKNSRRGEGRTPTAERTAGFHCYHPFQG